MPSRCSSVTPRSSPASDPAGCSPRWKARSPPPSCTRCTALTTRGSARPGSRSVPANPDPPLAAIPIPRPAAHQRHPRGGRGGDGRELGPDPQDPRRPPRRDDHRRQQPGARPDERDGPRAPHPSRRARSTRGRAARASPTGCVPATRSSSPPSTAPRPATNQKRDHRDRPRHQPRREQGHDPHQRARTHAR